MNNKILISLIFSTLFLFTSNVFATDYFTDSFDTYTVNTNLAGQNSWTGANGNAVIKNTQYYSLPQSVYFASTQIIARRQVQALGSGSFQGRIYFDGNGEMNIYVRKDNSTAPACLFSINANNGIVYKDIEQWKISILTGITFKNTWNLFAINFRTSDDMAQFCVNGTCSDYALCRYANANVSFTNIDGLGFKASDSIAGLAYFDNLVYSNVFYSPDFNGTCGSDNGQTLTSTPTNLCTIGTSSSTVFSYSSPSYWSWWCYGSNSGSSIDDELCIAYANDSIEAPTTAQCGLSSNTIVSSQPLPLPGSNQACNYGSISNMVHNADGSYSWDCVEGIDSVSCSTLPTIPVVIPTTLPSDNSISCSISPTDLSTFADCLGSIFRWVFLPNQSTLNDLYSIPQTLSTKVPFGYFYSASELLKDLHATAPSNYVLTLSFIEQDITIIDVNYFKSLVGQNVVDIYFAFLKSFLWIAFLIWIYVQGRDIFNNDKK